MKKVIICAAVFVATTAIISCNSGTQPANTDSSTTVTTPGEPVAAAVFAAGSFKGTIPGGAAKRDVTITLNADSTFNMTEAYLSKDGKPEHEMKTDGKWKFNGDTKEVYLEYKNLADRGTTFSVVDDKTIQMHDGSMQTPSTSGAEYNLTRQ
ncbi:hypothetical protein ECE50_012540 [Chitinophaga sp. Mgbs1]|uniref:Uncharacterized protein n=1 Tax=Chitinophaga solisilvae TaxID=1233460 RepID=A0A433W8S3_9BACT|nr:hypothetical protein [Chitinophaga solisilvae]